MPEVQEQRTLVKSPPELWAELSDIEGLARHLGEFGEIRITRTDPETTVAWEGELARGTVELEASGWGTRVTLTAEPVEVEPEPEPEPVAVEPEPEPEPAAVEPEPVVVVVAEPEPEPAAVEPEPEPEPEPVAVEPDPEPLVDLEQATVVSAAIKLEPEPKKLGFFARLFGRKAKPAPPPEPVVEPEPEIVEPEIAEPIAAEPVALEPEPEIVETEIVEPEPAEPEPAAAKPAPAFAMPQTLLLGAGPPTPTPVPAISEDDTRDVLTSTLDALGAAHHRPFSRG